MSTLLFAGLSAVQTQVALSLASGASFSAAAESSGIGRTTMYTWLKSVPEFAAAVEQAKAEYVLTLRDQLRDAAAKALATLTAILDDPKASPGVRLKAALAILNRPQFPEQGWTLPEKIGPPMQEQFSEHLAHLQAAAGTKRNTSEHKTAECSVPQRPHKIGHDEPCPCRSGRKYKHCCLNQKSRAA